MFRFSAPFFRDFHIPKFHDFGFQPFISFLRNMTWSSSMTWLDWRVFLHPWNFHTHGYQKWWALEGGNILETSTMGRCVLFAFFFLLLLLWFFSEDSSWWKRRSGGSHENVKTIYAYTVYIALCGMRIICALWIAIHCYHCCHYDNTMSMYIHRHQHCAPYVDFVSILRQCLPDTILPRIFPYTHMMF